MAIEKKKNVIMTFNMGEDYRAILEKLAKIHLTDMTSVLKQLILRESDEYGLIESRKKSNILDKG
jgi:hypothetical protein